MTSTGVESFGTKINLWAKFQQWRARRLADRLDVISNILPDTKSRARRKPTYRNRGILDRLFVERDVITGKLSDLQKQ